MKLFIRNIAWLQAGLLATQAVAFFISVVFYRHLGQSLYGLYAGLFVFLNTYGIIFSFDPGNILIHRIATSQDDLQRRDLAREGLTIALASAGLWAAGLGLTATAAATWWMNNSALSAAVAWTALVPLSAFPMQWALNLIQGLEDMKRAAGLLLLQNLSRPCGALGGFWLAAPNLVIPPGEEGRVLTAMVLGVVAVQLLTWIPALTAVRRHYPGLLSHLKPRRPTRRLVGDSLMLSIDKKTADQFDLLPRQLIGKIFSTRPEMLGWYDIAVKIFGLVQSTVNPISRTLLPHLSRHMMDPVGLRHKLRRIFRISLGVGTLLGLGGWAFTHWALLPYFYGVPLQAAFDISCAVALMMCLFPTFGWGTTNSTLALILDKIRPLFKIKIVMIFALYPLAWWLISLWGIIGAGAWVLIERGSLRWMAVRLLHRELDQRCEAATPR